MLLKIFAGTRQNRILSMGRYCGQIAVCFGGNAREYY